MTSELVALHEREDLVEVVNGRVADRHFFTNGNGTTVASIT